MIRLDRYAELGNSSFYRMMGRTSSMCSVKTYGNIFVRALFNTDVSTKQLRGVAIK